MIRRIAAVALGLALAAPATSSAATSVADTFRTANEALAAGRTDEAVAGYESLAALGIESPNLLYDLAAAQRRAGRPGRAILAIERLLTLDPGDDEARTLLDDVRTEVGKTRPRGAGTAGLFPRRGFLHAASARFRETDLAWATVVLSFLTFGLLIARRFAKREALRLGLAIAAPVSAALLAMTCTLLWSKAVREEAAAEAIVIAPGGTAVHEGPSNGSPESFRLPEGDVVRVIGRSNGWADVEAESGRRGWVAPGDVGSIFGPMPPPAATGSPPSGPSFPR
jgi:hypothetical protein